MSTALDLFLSVGRTIPLTGGSVQPAWDALVGAAAEWRRAGNHFSAAYAMQRAIHATGDDGARLDEAVQASIADCRRCVEDEPLDSLEALAALNLWAGLLHLYRQSAQIRRYREALYRELAERLLVVFGGRPDSVGFSIRGIELHGHLDGGWQAIVPPYVTSIRSDSHYHDGRVVYSLPSALFLFRDLRDYDALHQLLQRFPDEFDAASIRGWKFVIEAAFATTEQADLYARAADAFAQDLPPNNRELVPQGYSWSGENMHTWANYYRARATLARIPTTREQAKQLVAEASHALDGAWSGIVNEETFRLNIIIKALAAMVGVEHSSAIDEAVSKLSTAQWIFGENDADQDTQRLLAEAASTMSEFDRDPAAALVSGRIPQILDSLARIPAIGADIAESIKPAIGEHALSLVRGIDRTWVHRELEAIDDEQFLHQIFLRLKQASAPDYAQIRHGSLEYGKDVVVLESGRRILWMYQFKVGDINMPDWDAVKPQLEAMFLVPLQTVNIDTQVDEQIGVLVCNGHAGPNVDPVMSGWFAQELQDHGHQYKFIHLDSFANWIINDRLYDVFRAACREVASSKNKGVKKSSAAKKSAAKKPAPKKPAPKKPAPKKRAPAKPRSDR